MPATWQWARPSQALNMIIHQGGEERTRLIRATVPDRCMPARTMAFDGMRMFTRVLVADLIALEQAQAHAWKFC